MKIVSLLLFVATLLLNGCHPARPDDTSAAGRLPVVTDSLDISDIELPPPVLGNRFKTLEDWIGTVADSIVYDEQVHTYDLGLFESNTGEYVVFIHANPTALHNEPLRRYMTDSLLYYRLQGSEVAYPGRAKIVSGLMERLKKFAATPRYRSSALSRAGAVVLNMGEGPVINLNRHD